MSMRDQEAQALRNAQRFLLKLGSGEYKITSITALRKDARSIMKHYPLALDIRWISAKEKP